MSTVMLVDDHELIRQGLARAFERHDQMQVVAQAGSVSQALRSWETTRPDVVVTDLALPDGSGLEIVRAIRERDRSTGLVVLTMYSSDEQIFAAMAAGASAFVGKDARSEEVVRAAAHAAVAPLTFASPGLAQAMVRRMEPAPAKLSKREQDVLKLLAEGEGAQGIAKRLYLGESTVKTHISSIYKKLGVGNRAQALVTAMNLGLLPRVAGATDQPAVSGRPGGGKN